MGVKLQNFKITGLHGSKNFNISFEDNNLILIGENGSGKTTVLLLLYYFMSGRFFDLAQYNFKSLSLTVNGKTITVDKQLIVNMFTAGADSDYVRRRLSPRRYREWRSAMLSDDQETLRFISRRYDIPMYIDQKGEPVTRSLIDPIVDDLNDIFSDTNVMLLPTYRRIERDIETIFGGINEDEFREMFGRRRGSSPSGMAAFGMKDVHEQINSILSNLKEFERERLNALTLGYLGAIVDKEYEDVELDKIIASEDEAIERVLSRIQEEILSKSQKGKLRDIVNVVREGTRKITRHDNLVTHYLLNLLNFQEELEVKELPIKQFAEVCNEYLEDKMFEYNSTEFSYSVKLNDEVSIEREESIVELDDLSSGEMQIVSLFCNLYLTVPGDQKPDTLVLIDEPELSLSVTWQRRFLVDIARADKCVGLVAATHSPYIYDNELKNYARGIGEFIV